MRRGKVDGPYRGAGGQCPADGHPFGGERGHRVEGGQPGFIGDINQASHRREHLRVVEEGDHLVQFRRPLHQHEVGPEGGECLGHGVRRARAVVPDPEDMDLCHG
jgi:hypothetical protein